MDRTQEASVVARKISQLITVLQRERGASGVFLGSQGKNMGDVLLHMRGQTDAALADARTPAGKDEFGEITRNLNVMAKESTGNIQETIANLQRGSDLATQSMQETLGKARAGASNIERAGDLLTEIASGVSSISDRNMQIAAAVEEQSAVPEDINRNVMEINDAAIRLSSGAEQTAVTIQQRYTASRCHEKLMKSCPVEPVRA